MGTEKEEKEKVQKGKKIKSPAAATSSRQSIVAEES